MGNWIPELGVYQVNISELNNTDALDFAKKSIGDSDENNNLYDRYGYAYKTRIEVVRCGKLAEQAFALFLKEQYDVDVELDYEIYEGTYNVDKNDVFLNGLNIDVKSSKDTQKRGVANCLKSFNFPVPRDQEIKDITVSVIYDYDVENFYIAAWVDRPKYKKKATYGTFPIGKKQIPFYKMPLRDGYSIDEFDSIVDPNNFFVECLLDKDFQALSA